jgi:3-hydroxyisobutyrate dehydrogenase
MPPDSHDNGRDAVIGFIGLGEMGCPMALNLLKAGHQLVVWNRSVERSQVVGAAGATVVEHPTEVFARCQTIFTMLTDGDALDAVLGRHRPDFASTVRDRLVVNLATNSPSYANGLAETLQSVGARYAEAPVSGSRVPAERGELVAMLAGSVDDCAIVAPLLAPLCRRVVHCGAVPRGTLMKFSTLIVNIATITAIAEAVHFAERQGVSATQLIDVLLSGPLASDVARVKGPKALQRDFSPQAAIRNVVESNRLVVDTADETETSAPLMRACLAMYRRAVDSGFGDEDMIAVLKVYEGIHADGTGSQPSSERSAR